jgi:hypothetical protein
MPLTSDLQQTDPVRGQKHRSVPCIDVRACWDELTDPGTAVLEVLSLAAGLERRFFADRSN